MTLNRRTLAAIAIAAVAAPALVSPAMATPVIGQAAPAFRAQDADGRTRSLAEFKGKTVVLEWTNSGCPYVRKHYDTGAMQKLQAQATQDGVVWLTVISSAPGQQGYLTGPEARAWKTKAGAASTGVLLDPQGTVGKAYGARTTPHMYVVDKGGALVYMGGIDDKPSSDPADLKGATNYVAAALADVTAGRKVATAVTRPYGCGVKYAN